jgi:hypothetical protein
MGAGKAIEQALSRRMNRRQFLIQLGASLLAVVGVTSMLQALNTTGHHGTGQRHPQPPRAGAGAYGESTYGSRY